MNKNSNKFVASMVISAILLSSNVLNFLPHKVYANSVSRIGGLNRYETSKNIALAGFQGGSEYAIITTGTDFADALCAAPLSTVYNAPILVTNKDSLNKETKEALQTLGVKKVIILGGTGAVSKNVENQVKTIVGVTGIVERIGGVDRFETSRLIADRIGASEEAFLVTGTKLSDAMTVSSLAAKKKVPILLTKQNSLPIKVKQYIDNNTSVKYYIVGGTGVVGNSVASLIGNVERIAGQDRYETNAKFIEKFADDFDTDKLYLATGENDKYTDSIPGATLAAKDWAPIIFTKKTITNHTVNLLNKEFTPNTKRVALGGDKVITNTVLNSASIRTTQYTTSIGSNNPNNPTTYNGNITIKGAGVTVKNTVVNGNLYLYGSNVTLQNVNVKGKIFVDELNANITLENVEAKEVKVLAAENVSLNGVDTQKLSVETRNTNTMPQINVQGNTQIQSTFVKSTAKLNVSETANTGKIYVVEFNRSKNEVVLLGTITNEVVVKTNASIKAENGAIVSKVIIDKKNIEVNLDGKIAIVEAKQDAKIYAKGNSDFEVLVGDKVNKIDLVADSGAKVVVPNEVKSKVDVSGSGKSGIVYGNSISAFINTLFEYFNQNYANSHISFTKIDADGNFIANIKDSAIDNMKFADYIESKTINDLNTLILGVNLTAAFNSDRTTITINGNTFTLEAGVQEIRERLQNKGINVSDDVAIKAMISAIVANKEITMTGITDEVKQELQAIREALKDVETINNVPTLKFNSVVVNEVTVDGKYILKDNKLHVDEIRNLVGTSYDEANNMTISQIKERLNGKAVVISFSNGEIITITFQK